MGAYELQYNSLSKENIGTKIGMGQGIFEDCILEILAARVKRLRLISRGGRYLGK